MYKMSKKSLFNKYLVIILITLLLFISSCYEIPENSIKFPNLTNMSRSEISEVLDKYDITYAFRFSNKIINDESELDKFVSYVDGYKAGQYYPKDKSLFVYTTVLQLNPYLYDEVEIDFEWIGKSFINDGVGEVELVSTTDGDTARFRDIITGEVFILRFLGIDTPETYAGEDPWGLAASTFTKKRLNEAKTIILESEGARTEAYGRYLGFVWVDGVLLNLEIVEEAYSNSTLKSSKYKEYFLEANINSMKTGRRFFGETDPNYDYENKCFKEW